MTQTELKNDHIDLKIARNPACQVTMDVTVSPAKTREAHQEAVKRVKKEVSIPGFRKGRAPDNIILKQFGSHVDSEWRDLVVRGTFEASCEMAKVFPFDEHSVKRPKLETCSRDEGAQLQFEFECEPVVPEIKYSDVTIKREATEPVTDEQVESTIRDIRAAHADWEDADERPVQAADYVDLTIESLDDPGKTLCDDKRFELQPGKIGAWLLELLIGKKVGDTFEATSKLDEDQVGKIENFKPTNCKVTINAIKTIVLPELTDELAAKVGVETVDDLKKRIREDMEQAAVKAAKQKMVGSLDDALLESYPFELPGSLIASENRNRLQARLEQMKKAELPEEEIKEELPEEEIKEKMPEVEAEVADDVNRSLRMFFLMREVAQREQVQPSEDELMAELSRQLWQLPEHERVIDVSMEPQEMRSRLMVKIMMDQTRELLLDKVSIED